MTAIVQAECTDLWNAYFDQHGVDFIMTPSLWGDAATYNDVVSGSGSLSVKQADNAYKVQTSDLSEGFSTVAPHRGDELLLIMACQTSWPSIEPRLPISPPAK